MNLDFAKVCGKHSAIYEAYYKQIDPKSSGAIEAMTAAKFLKKSGLSDVVLSRVWDLSDPNGKGFLDKPGFFVALKLVSLAQAGQVINMSNIYTETANPPKVGDLPKIMPPRLHTAPPVSSGGKLTGDWSISVIDRLKYEQLFETLKPVGGMLPGNKVKGVLMDSKLPMDTLGKIWDLADQDKDGNLDKYEFIVAMHLVYQTLQNRTIPDVLPPELRKPGMHVGGGGQPPPKPQPPMAAAAITSMPRAPSGEGFSDGSFVASFPKDIAPPPAIPPLPTMARVPPVGAGAQQSLISTDPLIPIGAPPSVTANADWVVIPAELKRYEIMFREADRDKDGLVSGLEVKNVFIQSGVPQNCLAHIWALCDTNQSGKLTLEQFGLAMWMVERKQKGIEPPQVLTANMVPPSMRGIISGVDLQPQLEPKPTYSNPELEMISKEIEELAKERRALETEIAQKEADIRIKSGEVRSLQSELDTLSATLKQLENQRGEAQKRLDDLKAQSLEYQAVLTNLNLSITQVRNQVNKIREQCQKQEETINEQEGELNVKRSELQKLKDEEAALQKEYDDNNRELQKLTQHLQNTQLQISSVRSMVTQLMETQRQMTDALLMCRAAIENQDAELCSEYQLKIEPDLDDARKTLAKKIEEPKAADPFEDNNSSTAAVKNTTNGFATNGFGSDPFGGANSTTTAAARGGFDDSFNATSGFDSGGFDAFGNSSAFNQPTQQQHDPFGGSDAFGASKVNAVTPEPGKDDFGSDPFAALHAPTGQGQVLSLNSLKSPSAPPPRPESPSPALPPKKSKVPPPRPAPPRPNQGPARPTQPAMDAFGAPATSGGFADFADFDNKLSTIPTSTLSSSSLVTLSSNSSLFDNITNKSITTLTPSSSTTTTSSTISNTHLTRSITPLQQAASKAFTSNSSSSNRKQPSASGAAVSGPTDFSDDPFKDYRYEDPFSIKDPFADDDDTDTDPEKVFKDDLSSDDDDDNSKSTKNTTNDSSFKTTSSFTPPQTTFDTAKSPTSISNEFLDQFNAFNMNSSPVPSLQSTASGAIITGSSIANSSNIKSHSITPIPLATASSGASAANVLFDNFADFDAFSTKTSSSASSAMGGSINIKNNNDTDAEQKSNSKANTDSFFDAFNDNFDTDSNSELKKSNANIFDAFGDSNKSADAFSIGGDGVGSTGNLAAAVTSAFDAFEMTSTKSNASNSTRANSNTITKSAKIFDDFNDNTFEDDFFKTKTTTATAALKDNNLNLSFSPASSDSKNDNFAKFDAFDDSSDFSTDFSTALNNSINLSNNESNTSATAIAVGVATNTTTLPSKLAKVQNHTLLSKTLNTVGGGGTAEYGAKASEKFAADYSKANTFDDDLQEALKRSMMEK